MNMSTEKHNFFQTSSPGGEAALVGLNEYMCFVSRFH